MIDLQTLPIELKDKYDVVNNTFIRKDKGEVAEEREVEIGDVHSDDFQPQVKLKQWDNETNFSVRLIDSDRVIGVETEGNKIKFIKKDIEAHFYDIEKGFEFEVILKKKPKTNKVQMSIETKGLKFYYQPELTQEEIDEGNIRPENVIGSYAVYHESKQGDYSPMGLKNYRAGKAFHIYRPKIIDSAGTEVWGELNITDNLLTVEIPQDFLDNAVYPVRHAAGLTFGVDPESPGGSSTKIYGTTVKTHGDTFSGGAGDGVSMSIYGKKDTNNINIQMAVYDSDSPSNKISNSNTPSVSVNSTTAQWWTSSYISIPTFTAIQYYLPWQNDVSGQFYVYYDSTGSLLKYAIETVFSWPSTITWTESGSASRYSIYCTYTAGAAGTNMEINIGDAWKDVDKLEINIGDTWKDVTKVQLNVGDTWKTIFEP